MAASKQQEAPEREDHRASRPVFVQRVTLKSQDAQGVFRREYEYLAKNVDEVEKRCSQYLSVPQAEELIGTVRSWYDSFREELAGEHERIRKLKEQLAIDGVVEFTRPRSFEARYSSGLAVTFIRLCEQFDNFVADVETLRLHGAFDSAPKTFAHLYAWKRRLHKVAGRIRHFRNEIVSRTNKLREEHEQAGAEKPEAGAETAAAPADAGTPTSGANSPAVIDETPAPVAAAGTETEEPAKPRTRKRAAAAASAA